MTAIATRIAASLVLLCSLTACGSGGGVRRVSEPAASIQQLTVQADGSWSVDVRLNNYSSVPMRFTKVALAMTVDDVAAGTVQATPQLAVGPESADVATVALVPAAAARIVMADALARGRSVRYTLVGSLDAAPENAGSRSWRIDYRNALTPVPGLPGVLR